MRYRRYFLNLIPRSVMTKARHHRACQSENHIDISHCCYTLRLDQTCSPWAKLSVYKFKVKFARDETPRFFTFFACHYSIYSDRLVVTCKLLELVSNKVTELPGASGVEEFGLSCEGNSTAGDSTVTTEGRSGVRKNPSNRKPTDSFQISTASPAM